MVSTGKALHRGADLGHDHFSRAAGHARNGIEQAHGLFKRAIDRLDLGVKAGNRVIQAVNLTS